MTELFSERLSVCIDFANLSTFVALDSIFRLEDEFGISIGWLPLWGGLQRLSSEAPQTVVDDPLAAYKLRRQQARRKWAQQELRHACRLAGISEANGARTFDARMAAIGLMYLVREQRPTRAYIEAVFNRAFREGRDLDVDAIASMIGDERFPGFAAGQGETLLDDVQTRLMDDGVYQSPGFVLAGEVFQGRQHFPLIRWRLAGEPGLPPV